MGQAQQIKGEIQEIQKLKDIAEIMSAMAAANLSLYKKAKQSFGIKLNAHKDNYGDTHLRMNNDFHSFDEVMRLLNPNHTSFVTVYDAGEAFPLETEYALNIFIGSDMGFCGKFNKGIKDIARSGDNHNQNNSLYIGKQLTGLEHAPIGFPVLKVSGNSAEKYELLKSSISSFIESLFSQDRGVIPTTTIIRCIFNVLVGSSVEVFQCDIHIDSMMAVLAKNNGNNSNNTFYEHVFFDLYKSTIDKGLPEYLIIDPKLEDIQSIIALLQKQYLISIVSTIMIESLIAENQVRSSSMETTKDEAQQIIHQLNKKLAKERQARITGELIELITSFTSLNDAA